MAEQIEQTFSLSKEIVTSLKKTAKRENRTLDEQAEHFLWEAYLATNIHDLGVNEIELTVTDGHFNKLTIRGDRSALPVLRDALQKLSGNA